MPDHSQTAMTLVIGFALLMIVGWLAGWISQRGFSRMTGWLDRLGERFGALSSVGAALLILLAFGWLSLFGVTVAATFGGVMALQSNPGSGGLGLGAVLIGLLGAPFLIWNTIIKQTTLNFQKEGHITDRISKAVEQLGSEKTVKRQRVNEAGKRVYEKTAEGNPDFSKPVNEEVTVPNIEVRIGGLLSLERIAQDSTRYDNGRDHVRVMEILCAYVRENAPALSLDPSAIPFTTKRPRIDIQTAINVIKRRGKSQIAVEHLARYRLDLRESDLDGCDLSYGDFTAARLFRSRLEAANLFKSNLTGAMMQYCQISHTFFRDAVLHGTILDHASYVRGSTSSLSFSRLKSVFIEGADMSGLIIGDENAQSFFGSADTKLSHHNADAKKEGLDAAEEASFADLKSDDVTDTKPVSDSARRFLHWNPYTSNDLAAHVFRDKFLEAHGLRGWPFSE